MANKAKRLFDRFDSSEQEIIDKNIGQIDDNATLLKQARYINDVLNMAQKQNMDVESVMRKCGRCCLSDNALKLAKKLYLKSSTVDEFLELLNEADLGGKNLHIKDGKMIAVYNKCYCNIPRKIPKMNEIYCQCSAGWYQTLFEEVFGKPVNVKIIDTIVNGAAECVFEITYEQ